MMLINLLLLSFHSIFLDYHDTFKEVMTLMNLDNVLDYR